tara:strand:+ start:169 stop:525 length:357 start_codon:yes stop_codon:yes gene_type:complete
MKNWKPWTFEDSKIPVWLSKVAPIEIWALSFACFVFCRGKLSEETKRHETIHFQQQLEMLFVFQWFLYGLFWLIGYVKYRDGRKAYHRNPFEQEAYENESFENYLSSRKRFFWWKYKI